QLKPQLPGWQLIEEDGIRKLDRAFRVRNFAQALTLTNAVGALAEEEGHHPRLVTEWGRLRVTWWTHKIRDLHRNDFIMAARTDGAYRKLLEAGEIEVPSR
ncbi:MAG TPA: 4a-hydroxytetrahydrobiopterin dehydratase, partial [Dehalococcoidia bacterium]|nr:4a-hydroxytetrahydrobiopterin dehydratase [Dehalococcoidia bacterium]